MMNNAVRFQRLVEAWNAGRYRTAIFCAALTLAIAAVLLVAGRHTLLDVPAYELGDYAANSLSVREARGFREIYGAYSRWGFRHPGPALFYVYGLGEWLFHEFLQVVPAHCNAQVIANILLTSFFFAAALVIFASWTAARSFLPLALVFAVLHFSRVGGHVFFSIWFAHPPVLIFLCLLAAGASIAAGNGRHLPFLVLAGGFLVHIHVAQVTYVVPLALISYVALLTQAARARRRELPGEPSWMPAAWRTFAAAHIAAALLLAVFLFPLIVDSARGARSNLAAILEFQRHHSAGDKSFGQSLFYFVQFGTYLTFAPGKSEFDNYAAAEAWRFVRANGVAYTGWLLAWLVPAGWAAAHLRRRARPASQTMGAAPHAGLPRFIACGSGVALVAIASTLAWGMSQHGAMHYYLGDVNHAIYYFFALLAAAVVAHWMDNWYGRVWQVLLYAAVVVAGWYRAPAFIPGPPEPGAEVVKQSVVAAIARESREQTPKLLLFEHDAWPIATGVALQIVRAGSTFRVSPEWGTMFGKRYRWTKATERRYAEQAAVWRIRPGPPPPGALPLVHGHHLATEQPLLDLDPAAGAIRFAKDGNFREYMAYGWADSHGDWTASVGHTSVLKFRSIPAAGDVKLRLDVFPLLVPSHVQAQRLRLLFRGEVIAEYRVTEAQQLEARVPAALWNAQPIGTLRFEYPDAVASEDPRLLGLGFREIRFSLAPAVAQ